MSKVKPLLPGPVAAARRVLDECDVRHPRDIHVEAIAARYGAIVVYAPMDTARGALVRSANRAVIWIDQDAEGEAHARFTGAHEFAHFLRPSQLGNWWETRISSVVGTRRLVRVEVARPAIPWKRLSFARALPSAGPGV